MEYILYLSLLLLFWTYVGYPVAIYFCSLMVKNKPLMDEHHLPHLSLLIMTYNEAAVIERKLQNSLEIDYPKEQLEILIVDSMSTDDTVIRGSKFEARGVRVVVQPERKGKASAISFGLLQAVGDIVVVTDANAMLEPGALKKVARHFVDPAIGGVTGAMQQRNISNTSVSQSGDLYWKYEQWMRRRESQVHSVISMSGELSAYRKSIFVHDGVVVAWHGRGATDDFEQTLYMIRHGWRVLFEPQAVVWEPAPDNAQDLASQKVRIITQTIVSVQRNLDLLWKSSSWYGKFIFPSRKILPLFSPWLILISFIISIWSAFFISSPYWIWTAWLIASFISISVFALITRNNFMILRLFGFFLELNIFVVRSWMAYFGGRDFTVWQQIGSSRTPTITN